ncbi:type IV secretion system protein VirB10 [Paraburkholderia flagellata]|uniref:type IV secretion system protein VirB10 n=1 Tax=Paraburkholderia flagellata TaxID=2883241 RepID=UPI001F34EDE9|nr:type IV secretion system protein VirB10 [Paraburkholderia flagellata]
MSDNSQHIVEDAAEDRGMPVIAGRRKGRIGGMVFAAVGAVLIALIVATIALTIQRMTATRQAAHKEVEQQRKDKAQAGSGAQTDLGSLKARVKAQETQDQAMQRAASEAAAAHAAAASAASASIVAPIHVAQQQGTVPNPYGAQAAHPETPQERRLAGGVLEFDDGKKDSDGAANDGGVQGMVKQAAAQLVPGSGGGLAGQKSTNPLDQQLEGSESSRAAVRKAGFLPNLSYLLKKSTIIRCVMSTKVNTTYPGMTDCQVSRDVYSADGRTLLIRKGADVTGEQRTALTQGQARIMVLWTRIDDGPVKVELDSPVTDSLGGSGMEAYVDNHWLARFGGGILVSLISDFGSAIANKSVGNSGVTFSTTTGSTESMAAEILKSSVGIPPTAYSNQGDQVNIYVAQDVDFSDVYERVRVDGGQ